MNEEEIVLFDPRRTIACGALGVVLALTMGFLYSRMAEGASQGYVVCSSVLICSAPSGGAGSELDVKVQSLVEQISKSFTEPNKIKIAVCNFVDLDGKPSDFGIYLAEELITRLFQSGHFEVVERRLLDKVLDEQKLTTTGVLDAASAQKLGSVLGVQAIVTGTLTDLQSTLKVNARIVSAQSGSVFAAASETISKTGDVLRLLPQAATQTSSPRSTESAESSRVAGGGATSAPKTPSVVHAGPRFTKYDDGVIKDSKTGLEWHVGPTKVNFDEATSWVAALKSGGGAWRMPTLNELQGLYQEGLGKHNRDFAFEPCGGFIWAGDTKTLYDHSITINGHPREVTGNGFDFKTGNVCGSSVAFKGFLLKNGAFATRSAQR